MTVPRVAGPASGHGVVVLHDATDAADALAADVLAADLRHALGEVQEHGGPLVVDLSGVPTPSSATVALLLQTQRACRRDGVRLVVRGLSRRALRLFREARLDQVFDCAGNEPPPR